MTNTGATNVYGSVGTWPATTVEVLPSRLLNNETIRAGNPLSTQAHTALNVAFGAAAGAGCQTNLSGQDLGGLTLTAGVYCFSSSAQLTGKLTLDAQGNPNAVFIFQIGNSLTTATGSSVIFVNGGQGGQVVWQVSNSATLGVSSAFAGKILALSNITLDADASIQCGSASSISGTVTMNSNDLSSCATLFDPADAAEPSTGSLLFVVGLPGLLLVRRLRSGRP